MKKIIITCIFALSLIFPSCLDVDAPGRYSDDQVWASIRNLDYSLKSFYYDALYNGNVNGFAAPAAVWDAYSDLMKYSYYTYNANRLFSTPNWLSEDNPLSPWTEWYRYIKKMNDFLVAVNDGDGDGLDRDQLNIRIGEVRFLRAFLYQGLVNRHGGVVLRVSETKLDGPDEALQARETEERCWDFIIGEYEEAARLLPEAWTAPVAEYGRVTKGAAYGMLARAALSAGRWDRALQAAGEVEKLAAAGHYELLSNFGNIFTQADNKELLLPVYYSANNGHQWDQYACPSGDQKVFGTVYIGGLISPTDEFASSYDIKVGDAWRVFTWDDVRSGTVTDPWTNRDPRFYTTVLYNGAKWRNRDLEYYVDGQDGFLQYVESGASDVRKSVTGYGLRKYLSTEVDWKTVSKSKEYWIVMRYAEVLLMMSEAYARKTDMGKAYEYLNKIRIRAGMPELSQKPSWEAYLADLQKERICELGGEGHRFWDLRRWGIATSVLAGSRTHGIKITKSGNNLSYERIESDITDRIFPAKYNLFPIPAAEVRRNTLCIQDDIWK
ncbi:MAG: RagB/SusD family nutrient uptake outer membrane protein [Bacteroidales bacterium]|jgi:hypothetical protein|nr:RagB/SusD family nutrient uptake outer membrane protein [Bacteroidales bacterium]